MSRTTHTQRRLAILSGLSLVLVSMGLGIAGVGIASTTTYNGFFYNEGAEYRGEASGALDITPSDVTGTITLANLDLQVALNQTDEHILGSSDYTVYEGEAEGGGQTLPTDLWYNETGPILTFLVKLKDARTLAVYLFEDPGAQDAAELLLFDNRLHFTNEATIVLPEPPNSSDAIDAIPATERGPPSGITTSDSFNSTLGLIVNADELLEPDANGSSTESGQFYRGPGEPNTDDEYTEGGAKLHFGLAKWERDVRWLSTFDETPLNGGANWERITAVAWSPGLGDATGGAAAVDWGRTTVQMEIEDTTNAQASPLRFDGASYIRPGDNEQEAFWGLVPQIGYGPVGVDINVDFFDHDGAEVLQNDVDKVKVEIGWDETDEWFEESGDETPDDRSKAHGLKVGFGAASGASTFYEIESMATMEYYRSICSWYHGYPCFGETYYLESTTRPLMSAVQASHWDASDDPLIAKGFDYDYADRTTTDTIQHDGDPGTRSTFYELEDGQDTTIYSWHRLRGPITEGKTLKVHWYLDGDYQFSSTREVPDPATGYSYFDLEWAPTLTIEDTANADAYVGQWRADFYPDYDFMIYAGSQFFYVEG